MANLDGKKENATLSSSFVHSDGAVDNIWQRCGFSKGRRRLLPREIISAGQQ